MTSVKTPRSGRGQRFYMGYKIQMKGQSPFMYLDAHLTKWGAGGADWKISDIDPQILQVLPVRLTWPNGEIDSLHSAINAIMGKDILVLTTLAKQYPRHVFGFEDYVKWLQHRILVEAQNPADAQSAVLVPASEAGIISRDLVAHHQVAPSIKLAIYVVRTKVTGSWMLAVFHSGSMTLTKAWIDILTGKATLFEDHRGRWQALGARRRLIREWLGDYATCLRRTFLRPSDIGVSGMRPVEPPPRPGIMGACSSTPPTSTAP